MKIYLGSIEIKNMPSVIYNHQIHMHVFKDYTEILYQDEKSSMCDCNYRQFFPIPKNYKMLLQLNKLKCI